MSIATNLKQQMIAHDLTTAQLSEMSGVSKGSLSIYLKGHTKPAEEVLERLAAALNCTPKDLDKPRQIRQRGKNVPVETAARIMGKEPQGIRLMLQRGKLPFGYAVKNEGSTKFNYYINQADFEDYIGCTLEEALRELEQNHVQEEAV